ncbi:MAG: VWA domain-containing protein [Vicinamibacteria bacterium]
MTPSFPVAARRVVVDVVVTDRDGAPVAGLTAADFEVSEDGKPQAVVSFEEIGATAAVAEPGKAPVASPEARPPVVPRPSRLHVIALDDVNLTPYKMSRAKAAAAAFLRALPLDDRVLLVPTSSGQGKLSNSAESREELVAMLRDVPAGHLPDMSVDRVSDFEAMMIYVLRDPETEARVKQRISKRSASSLSVAAIAGETWMRAASRIQTTLRTLDRVIAAVAAEKGRKSIVLVSEGFVLSPRSDDFRAVTQAAMQANAVFYFLDARQMVLGASEYPIESIVLGTNQVAIALADQAGDTAGAEALAEDTGGFSIRNSNDLAGGLRRIAAESRAYYLVGYDPAKEPDGRYRKIKVRVQRKDVRVRARKGYYADVATASRAR